MKIHEFFYIVTVAKNLHIFLSPFVSSSWKFLYERYYKDTQTEQMPQFASTNYTDRTTWHPTILKSPPTSQHHEGSRIK